MRQRSFDDEFKKMDVELSKLKGSVKEAAEELNIDPSLLSKWRNRAEFNAEKVMMEIRRLKKVLKNAELERDILKKQSASSSRETGDIQIYSLS